MRGSVELFSFVKATKIQIALDTDPKSDPAALSGLIRNDHHP
jgi:hypothetical protein